jgi:hypothetical protein
MNRLRKFVALVYRRLVRAWLPGRNLLFAGIKVPLKVRLLDQSLSRGNLSWLIRRVPLRDNPQYEGALISGLKEYVRTGDQVVVIGGGIGVTATFAAMRAGPAGRVICFEVGLWQVLRVMQTSALNNVRKRVTVVYGAVGSRQHAYSFSRFARRVSPLDLPECDLLELDCEGSEKAILSEMTLRPRVILVETHGVYGSSTAQCRQLLEGLGYRVDNLGVAETSMAKFCADNDIMVLAGVRLS